MLELRSLPMSFSHTAVGTMAEDEKYKVEICQTHYMLMELLIIIFNNKSEIYAK